MALTKKGETKLRSFKLIVSELDQATKLAKAHLNFSGATELIIELLRKFISEYKDKPVPNENQGKLDIS